VSVGVLAHAVVVEQAVSVTEIDALGDEIHSGSILRRFRCGHDATRVLVSHLPPNGNSYEK
jgi:hypothetical protein